MSKHDLVAAYLAGQIERRAFVRGLVALGVSSGAAAAYAVALSPQAAADRANVDVDDFYEVPKDPPRKRRRRRRRGNGNGKRGGKKR